MKTKGFSCTANVFDYHLQSLLCNLKGVKELLFVKIAYITIELLAKFWPFVTVFGIMFNT